MSKSRTSKGSKHLNVYNFWLLLFLFMSVNLWAEPVLTIAENPLGPLPAGNIGVGSDAVINRFILIASESDYTVTGISLNISSSSTYTTSDINSFKLWYNSSNTMTGATELKSVPSAANTYYCRFDDLSQKILNGTTGYIFITASISPNAAFGHTIMTFGMMRAYLTIAETLQYYGNSFPPGVQTIDGPLVSMSDGQDIPDGNIRQGSYSNLAGSFNLKSEGYDINLTKVKFNTSGTYAETDLFNYYFRLFVSSNPTFDGTVSYIGCVCYNCNLDLGPGIKEIEVNQHINKDQTLYFYITSDISASAVFNHNLIVDQIDITNFTFDRFATKNGTAKAGGKQTIIYPTVKLSDIPGSTVSAKDIIKTTENNLIYSFKIKDLGQQGNLTEIDFNTAGTSVSSDLTALKLWYNNVNDLPSATLTGNLNNSDFGTGAHSFNNISIINDENLYFFITADVAAGATTGHNLYVQGLTASSLIFDTDVTKEGSSSDAGAQNIAVCQPVEISIQPSDNHICSGSDINLSVNVTGHAPYSYQWQLFNTVTSEWGNLSDNATYSGSVTNNTMSNSNTLYITDLDVSFNNKQYRCIISNCNNTNNITSDASTIKVDSPIGDIGNITGKDAVCPGESGVAYSIEPIESATNYMWMLPPAAMMTSGGGTSSIEVTFGNFSGDVFVTVFNACGASNQSTLAVAVNTVDASILTSGAVSFCDGSDVTLTAQPEGAQFSYLWSSGELTKEITKAVSGEFTVTVTNNLTGCSGIASVTLTAKPNPVVNAANTGPYCTDKTLELTSAGNNLIAYSWSGPNGFASNLQNPTKANIANADAGLYTVTVTANNNCTASASTQVAISGNSPYFDFTGNPGFVNQIVSPLFGAPADNYHFEVVYYDADNNLAAATYPRLMLDYEGNGNFNDANDRSYIMQELDPNDNNTVNGKVYFYNVKNLPSGNNYQAKIIANDNSASSCSAVFGAFNAPNVLLASNMYIFANDIKFSNQHPATNSPLQVCATIHNESDFAANNFDVRLINQYDPAANYGDITVQNLLPHTTTDVCWNITTPADPSWNPMQVIVDVNNVIAETNELDNQAIRPFVCGDFALPGDIKLTAAVSPFISYVSSYNILTVYGKATYRNTAVELDDPSCAGATVTMTVPATGATYTGYTNNQGDYSIQFAAPAFPGNFQVNLTVTDYTLDGDTIARFILLPPPVCEVDLSSYLNLTDYCIVAGDAIGGTFSVSNNFCGPFNFASITSWTSPGSVPAAGNANTAPFAAGATQTFNFPQLTFNNPGTFNVCVNANANNVGAEASFNNNSYCRSVRVLPACPDIVPADGTSRPYRYKTFACAGQSEIPFVVYNAGGLPTGNNITVQLSIFAVGNPVALSVQQQVIGNIPSLCSAPNNYIPVSFLFGFPNAGQYRLVFETDINNNVPNECDENNNTDEVPAIVVGCAPDLYVSRCGSVNVAPVDPYTVPNINVSAVIGNSGDDVAIGPITVNFAWGGNNQNVVFNGNLNPGATATINLPIAIPAAPGVNITVAVNQNNAVPENNFGNNSYTAFLGFDFYLGNSCGSNWWNSPKYCGQPFTIGAYLYSSGIYVASNVKTSFWLSGPGLAAGWNYLGFAVNTNVGITCACPYFAQLPGNFTLPDIGTYQLKMITNYVNGNFDPNNPEINYANNDMTVNIQSVCKPDYRVLSEYIEPSKLNPEPNEPITVDVSYYNIGSSYPYADQMDIKLKGDNNDIQTVQDRADLANGEHQTTHFNVPWSSPIVGVHVLRAYINNGYFNDPVTPYIDESDTTNNQATRAVVVGSLPNLRFVDFTASNYAPDLNEKLVFNFTIENQGYIDADADIIFKLIDDNGAIVQFHAFNNQRFIKQQSVDFHFTWQVTNPTTTIYAEIVNTVPEEFTYVDNLDSLKLSGFSLSLHSTPASCSNSDNGNITSEVSGGVPPYIYQWSNGANADNIEAGPGDYTLTVFDNEGHSVSKSKTITAEFDAPDAAITPVGPLSVCEGSSVELQVTNPIDDVHYTWFIDDESQAGNHTSFTATVEATYKVLATTDAKCSAWSNSVVLTVNALPSVTIAAQGATTITEGSSVELDVTDYNILNNYQWYKDGAEIADATNSSYSATVSGSYYAVTRSFQHCEAQSNSIDITVNPAATIAPAGPIYLCNSGSVKLTANSGAGLKYQWYKNNALINNSTRSYYTATSTGNYYVAITNFKNESYTSNTVIFEIQKATLSPAGTISICQGKTYLLKASTGTGFNYQWQKNLVNIDAAVNSSYTADQAGNYRVLITTDYCDLTSNTTTINIKPLPEATITPDGSTTVCFGNSVVMNANHSDGFTYSWKKNNATIRDATNSTFTAITSGNYTVAVTSNACVNTSLPQTVFIDIQAKITPAAPVSICQGSYYSLRATTGVGYTYQWKFNDIDIADATNSTFKAYNAGDYTVSITTPNCITVSSPTTVIVNPLPNAVISADSRTTFCPGESVTLSTDNTDGLVYQWKKNNISIPGETNSSYTADTTGSYTVYIATPFKCAKTSPATRVTVDVLKAKITPAASTTICEGSSVSLRAQSGKGYTYVWRHNGSIIDVATAYAYSAKLAGEYIVTVTTFTGCTTVSDPVTVTVNALPEATITPAGPVSFCYNGNVLLNANNGAGLTYKWKKNNVYILGATDNNYLADSTATFTLVVTNANNCSKTSPYVRVTEYALPVVSLGEDKNITTAQSIVLTPTNNYSTYTWNTGAKTKTINVNGATAGVGAHVYSITVTNVYKCTASDEVTVNVTDPAGRMFNNDYQFSVSNQPNPFTNNTLIEYSLPESAQVVLKVYNAVGAEVRTLVNSAVDKGIYQVNFDASDLVNGIYMYNIQINCKSNNYSKSGYMIKE